MRHSPLSAGHCQRRIYGPLADLGTIREYVEPRRPAYVWFFYEGNDLTDLSREMKSDILRRHLEPRFHQQLEEHADVLGEEMRRRYDSRLAPKFHIRCAVDV